jgi:hypothetical protein
MASAMERRRLDGVLCGEGRETRCVVSASKVDLAGTTIFHFSQFEIESVETTLPDGNYWLLVSSEIVKVHHQNGEWL